MVTLTIIALLVFVPASRRVFSGLLTLVLAVLGIVFVVTQDSHPHRKGFRR